MTEICGVSVSDGWLATAVVGGLLILVGAVLWGMAEIATRRYVRARNHPHIRRRAESWRPPEAREEPEDE